MDSKGRSGKGNLLGRGNVVLGGAGTNGNQHLYGRRHVSGVGGVLTNAFVASPASLYNTPQPVDPFCQHLSDPFPSTPYTPVGHLYMSAAVRNARPNAPLLMHSAIPNITPVTSSKFAHYITIYNMENAPAPSLMNSKLTTQMYQTTARYTGKYIALRRLVMTSATAEECIAVNERFRHYRHPNLVPLTGIILTDEFVMGSNDAIMEYKFISGAKSLHEEFFLKGRATEGLLWSFACQMVGLLRAFHETSVPLRGLHWSKILYVSVTGRFYFSGIGLVDLVEARSTNASTTVMMKQDIQALGIMLLQLSTRNLAARLDDISNQPMSGFSKTFWTLVKACLEGVPDIRDLCCALGERMSMEVAHQEGHADYLVSQCAKEVHNGRLMRLMVKLNFVLESLHEVPENSTEAHNRYALRLFSQYVFNQVDEHHRVRVDWGHVFHSLNKLDCGSEELVQLIGNDDGNTILVISYRDLRASLESAFEQLQLSANDADIQTFSVTVGATPVTLQ
ncbi:PAB-dependent poly(A)-specific ribonuclease subunit 3 [Trypanosoma rangeli]|uniref:PAB-dependent poly(A)-specific ribonuclease subunit 3 n=1 Tax=Trypanosoma rangeli TaxID=5698 RepID=A0A422NJH8_TRYRA|nr:PAB-dependent poly(A)-specific ribonuclease subunit 3 [Trypanosoma rangeli]RNF05633.1 PAB-dependent poly(A)-specific ribonuclease subunit 3 [Trypanosoma rangeli]|eukprot:RNF05633.1 PAB-dependent poly(A)-specific ribonuclease subunit 3 [Trypanosoma rangeli]